MEWSPLSFEDLSLFVQVMFKFYSTGEATSGIVCTGLMEAELVKWLGTSGK